MSMQVKLGGQGRDRTADLPLFSSQADMFSQVGELRLIPLTWASSGWGYGVGYPPCDIVVTHLIAGCHVPMTQKAHS